MLVSALATNSQPITNETPVNTFILAEGGVRIDEEIEGRMSKSIHIHEVWILEIEKLTCTHSYQC